MRWGARGEGEGWARRTQGKKGRMRGGEGEGGDERKKNKKDDVG